MDKVEEIGSCQMKKTDREMYLYRLKSWEHELNTNENHLQHIAPQIVADLKSEIQSRWPGPEGVT